MNVVIICSDTFRYDHLGFLGRQPVMTPNLDRLARESAHFTDFRLCSFPTLVNRIEVFSGRYTYPFVSWGALPFHYPVLAEIFQRHGVATSLLGDNPHLMKPEFGFSRGFDFIGHIPGQMHSKFRPKSDPMIDLPCAVEKLDPPPDRLERYRRNAFYYREQGTTTTALLFQQAIQWLQSPPDKFFLWIDAFDPHEPWDAPREFLKPYPWDDKGEAVIWPRSGRTSAFTEADLTNIRSLYKSEVTQIDHWVGRLLDHLQNQGLLQSTAVLFCSDHGFLLGELGLIGKMFRDDVPHYNRIGEFLGHLPLLVRHPDGVGAGRTIPGLCQPPDLFATALDLAGIPKVPWGQGYSLVPRLNGEPSPQRFAVSGSFPNRRPGNRQTVWTEDWCFIFAPLNGLDGSELFHRSTDPNLERNVLAENPAVARDHLNLLTGWMDGLRVPLRRRRALLDAAPFGWKQRWGQRAWTLRNRLSWLSQFRNYSRRHT